MIEKNELKAALLASGQIEEDEHVKQTVDTNPNPNPSPNPNPTPAPTPLPLPLPLTRWTT